MKRLILSLLAFACMLAGDYFLVFVNSPLNSSGFLYGLIAFCAAQVLWSALLFPVARFNGLAALALGIPVALFTGIRLAPEWPTPVFGLLMCLYACFSVLTCSLALGCRRVSGGRTFGAAFLLLLFSDSMIGESILGGRLFHAFVGPTYVVAFGLLILAVCQNQLSVPPCSLRRMAQRLPRSIFLLGTASLACLVAAMRAFPGTPFNPCTSMLSRLGREEIRSIRFPLCSVYFLLGLVLAALAAAILYTALRDFVPRSKNEKGIWRYRRYALEFGGAFNVAGLLTIAYLPEGTPIVHNVGCYLACIGGGLVSLSLAFGPTRQRLPERGRKIVFWLAIAVLAVFSLFLFLHEGLNVIPFSPCIPTAQKILILFFAAVLLLLNAMVIRRFGSGGHPVRTWILTGLGVLAVAFVPLWLAEPQTQEDLTPSVRHVDPDVPWAPLTPDELAAQSYLASITCDLATNLESETWSIGGHQLGNLSKRYQIAFTGYAAVALGMRTPAYTGLTASILRSCIDRMLEKSTWDYVKVYWPRKPWFPDPCYEENVMYTGHLLELMALYEAFTGDTRYHETGFDFVWNTRTTIHYDIEKLLATTLRQIHANRSGGVSCEPNLIFFPCNNHLQIALELFERLGLDAYPNERTKWETWAIKHYPRPILGGGVLSLAYHRGYRLMVPLGHSGLDAWSLLWYLPWAANTQVPASLWQQATKKIDWRRFGAVPVSDSTGVGAHACCDPAQVPDTATASFLDAAARAYGDTATAVRVEQGLDRYLCRDNGLYYLKTRPGWSIGCSANRIIALALQHGSDFRRFLLESPLPATEEALTLTEVLPRTCRVTEAYRVYGTLHLALTGTAPDGISLKLESVPAALHIETEPAKIPFEWHLSTHTLVFRTLPRRVTIRDTRPVEPNPVRQFLHEQKKKLEAVFRQPYEKLKGLKL